MLPSLLPCKLHSFLKGLSHFSWERISCWKSGNLPTGTDARTRWPGVLFTDYQQTSLKKKWWSLVSAQNQPVHTMPSQNEIQESKKKVIQNEGNLDATCHLWSHAVKASHTASRLTDNRLILTLTFPVLSKMLLSGYYVIFIFHL